MVEDSLAGMKRHRSELGWKTCPTAGEIPCNSILTIITLIPACLLPLDTPGSSPRQVRASRWASLDRSSSSSTQGNIPEAGRCSQKEHLWVLHWEGRGITGDETEQWLFPPSSARKAQESCPHPQGNMNLDPLPSREQQDERGREQQLKQQEQWEQERAEGKCKRGAAATGAEKLWAETIWALYPQHWDLGFLPSKLHLWEQQWALRSGFNVWYVWKTKDCEVPSCIQLFVGCGSCAPPGVFSSHSLSRERGHAAHTLSLLSGICGFDNTLLLKLSLLLLIIWNKNVSFAVPSWFELWFAHQESTFDSSPLENVIYFFM